MIPASLCQLRFFRCDLVLVPFVSHRAGAYGRLILATYECIVTGGLSACDWLTHVTLGGCRVAPPGNTGGGGGG